MHSSRRDEVLLPQEKKILDSLQPLVLEELRTVAQDAGEQADSLASGLELRDLIGESQLAAVTSLHLSSHGAGVGPFEKGWLYDLDSDLNRTRFFSPLDELLRKASGELPLNIALHLKDTLRPSKLRNWQSYLPDRPELGAEPAALAGMPGFSLVTVQDSRAYWGDSGGRARTVCISTG